MNFRDYYYRIPVKDRPEFAQRLKTSVGYLNMIAAGHRTAGESLAMRIERETERQVTCEEMRPDVPWEVVRNTPAPAGLSAAHVSEAAA